MRLNRGKISSDLSELNRLHLSFPFIPDEQQIRPSEECLQKKESSSRDIEENWKSIEDFILCCVFHKPASIDRCSNRLKADTKDIKDRIRFVENEFPYCIDPTVGNHYILWLGPKTSGKHYTDEEIDECIRKELKELTNGDNYDYAWYENPKMTISEVYHVQVFWCRI